MMKEFADAKATIGSKSLLAHFRVLGNLGLTDAITLNQRQLDPEAVPKVTGSLIHELRQSQQAPSRYFCARNFYVALRDETLPGIAAINDALSPYLLTVPAGCAWPLLQGRTEHCLIAKRGRPEFIMSSGKATVLTGPEDLDDEPLVLMAPREGTPGKGRHSRKPEKFYDMVEFLCYSPNRLELFARRKRIGWVSHLVDNRETKGDNI
jgi:hypothetical protein